MSGKMGQKDSHMSFSFVTSYNVGNSPQNFVTFSFNLSSHCSIPIPTIIDKIYETNSSFYVK